MPHSKAAETSTTVVTHQNVLGSSVAATTQPNAVVPNNAPAVEEEACETEMGLNVAATEGAPDEKNSPTPAAPPS